MALQKGGRFETGRGDALAPARTRLLDARGGTAGVLTLSAVGAEEYAQLVERVTGADVVVSSGTATCSPRRSRTPARSACPTGARSRSAAAAARHRLRRPRLQRRARQGPPARGAGGRRLSGASIEVVAILLAALIAAFAFALTVSRSLQAQIERLLDAARKLAAGDFGIEVPTEGNDEFAALGTEFNLMARELQKRLEELQLERKRLREAIRRVGQSFAKGLDRDAVLEIVVQTAVDGVGAEVGRAAVRTDAARPLRGGRGRGRRRALPRRDQRRRGRRAERRGRGGDRSTATSRSRTRCAPRRAAASSAC